MDIEETNHQAYCTAKSTKANRSLNRSQCKNFFDKDSTPLIQTPPFPEYPVGRGFTSSCAATFLTQIIGNTFINRFC